MRRSSSIIAILTIGDDRTRPIFLKKIDRTTQPIEFTPQSTEHKFDRHRIVDLEIEVLNHQICYQNQVLSQKH